MAIRVFFVTIALQLVAVSAVAGSSAPASEVGGPAALLDSAFDKMFNYPSVRTVELRIFRNGRVAGRREFDVAYTKFNGLGHTILRFRAPEYLRDHALLMIEAEAGGNNTWLYQPAESRIRRVSTYQKADSFYGSDLTFEDLENRRWQNYSIQHLGTVATEGREFHAIQASPLAYSHHSRIVVYLTVDSLAIGRIEFYKGPDASLAKTIRIALDEIVEEGGIFKPKRMSVEVAGRNWTTEILIKRNEVSPELMKREFSTLRLHSEGQDLFRMVEALKMEADSKLEK